MNKKVNYIMISPNFPLIYYKFAKTLKDRGINVLGIGDAYPHELCDELKENLLEYRQCYNLNDLHNMIKIVDSYKNKYQNIDWIESNNEFWLENDSILREWFNIPSGIFHSDILKYKAKSEMKKYFINAGVKCSRFTLSTNFEEVAKFAEEVGYPIFVKPDIGVGSCGTHKIKNFAELQYFYNNKDEHTYIFEQYIDGEIYSFDGITNSKGEIIFSCSNRFLVNNDLMVHEDTDDAYFTYKNIPTKLKEVGEKIVKSFEIKSRCFHIEIFKLRKDHPGLGKKNEFVALEVNMRPAGGYTPDLISIATNTSFYQIYADMIAYDENRQPKSKDRHYAISVSRKDRFNYALSYNEVLEKYKDKIVYHGEYPKAIADNMGDKFFMAKFDTLNEALLFDEEVRKKL